MCKTVNIEIAISMNNGTVKMFDYINNQYFIIQNIIMLCSCDDPNLKYKSHATINHITMAQ